MMGLSLDSLLETGSTGRRTEVSAFSFDPAGAFCLQPERHKQQPVKTNKNLIGAFCVRIMFNPESLVNLKKAVGDPSCEC